MQILGFGTYWAFADGTVHYHPLPRSPRYPAPRASRVFQTINLALNAFRQVNIVGLSPPLRVYPSSSRRTLSSARTRAALHHLSWAVLGFVLIDLSSYIPFRLAPDTFGSSEYVGGDYDAWVSELSTMGPFEVPVRVIRAGLAAAYGAQNHFGMTAPHHLLAFLGIVSGVWIPEEWPDLADWPLKATSLNELWGRRWHQLLRVSDGRLGVSNAFYGTSYHQASTTKHQAGAHTP